MLSDIFQAIVQYQQLVCYKEFSVHKDKYSHWAVEKFISTLYQVTMATKQ